nr:MAG TPA: hypothetical protein [Caudoviricetes sp.]
MIYYITSTNSQSLNNLSKIKASCFIQNALMDIE